MFQRQRNQQIVDNILFSRKQIASSEPQLFVSLVDESLIGRMLRLLYAVCDATPAPSGFSISELLNNAVEVLLVLWSGAAEMVRMSHPWVVPRRIAGT
jgi:hypothetical protein